MTLCTALLMDSQDTIGARPAVREQGIRGKGATTTMTAITGVATGEVSSTH